MNKLNVAEITVTIELNLNQSAAYLLSLSRVSAVKMKKEKSSPSSCKGPPLDISVVLVPVSTMTASCCRAHCLGLAVLCSLCTALSLVIVQAGYHSSASLSHFISASSIVLSDLFQSWCVWADSSLGQACAKIFCCCCCCSVMMDETWCSSALCCALLICTVNDTEHVRVLRVLNWLVNNGNHY